MLCPVGRLRGNRFGRLLNVEALPSRAMAGLFSHLFDNEYRQREDIETLRLDAELDADNFMLLRRQLLANQKRVDRAELVLEAMFMYLENQGLMTRETLAVLIREVDGLDGKIDGRADVKPTEE